MKNIILLVFTMMALACSNVYGQATKVKGHLYSDTAELHILNIFPDSFPNVSVVFKAEKRNGEPVWNLTKDKIKVKEDNEYCNIIALQQISKSKPLNLGIVIDHSGSMSSENTISFNYSLLLHPPSSNVNTPLDNAKESVKNFIKSFNSKKDFISIIGFSDSVDKKLSLTQDTFMLNTTLDAMNADYGTALYDAMIIGINEIKKAAGIKALVVLTDGQDNSSRSRWSDVINTANKENIPVYIIGLGNANTDTLKHIADSTKGQFYYTKNSSSLHEVYASISRQLQAFYDLVYTSSNFSSNRLERNIELTFDVDSIFLISKPGTSTFPKEVVAYVEKKEKQKTYFIFAGIAIIALVGIGLLRYKLNKKQIVTPPGISNVYPNPTSGNIHLDYTSKKGQLKIVSSTGQPVKTIDINGNEKQFNLSDLPPGNYFIFIESGELVSNSIEIVIQH